jgi:cob(I)alamin adenosyltransferase
VIRRVTDAMVEEAEALIDRYMSEVDLPPKFVIPGGNLLSAHLDVARTAIRRAERRISTLAEAGELASPTVIHFVNRASDLAYAMARWADVDDPALFEGRGR